jgi:hypothetical protein
MHLSVSRPYWAVRKRCAFDIAHRLNLAPNYSARWGRKFSKTFWQQCLTAPHIAGGRQANSYFNYAIPVLKKLMAAKQGPRSYVRTYDMLRPKEPNEQRQRNYFLDGFRTLRALAYASLNLRIMSFAQSNTSKTFGLALRHICDASAGMFGPTQSV